MNWSSKFGKEKWEEVLEDAGLPKSTHFLAIQDIEDAVVLKLVDLACKVLNIWLVQAADAFGDYWVNDYAAKIYKAYYRRANSAKEMLLNMNDVHKEVTSSIKNAHPPKFEYEWKDDHTLIMTYHSERGLIDFLVGLIKGVGKYFKENLEVKKLGNTVVEIVFS
ncbi:MAG: heme NO-binding domain-containing protein [Deltaproteobacteria bacterium]|nr:heme NO-binding domain-containing protein [Deltaproteobacteria bacterium]